jgi:hypothetical protein
MIKIFELRSAQRLRQKDYHDVADSLRTEGTTHCQCVSLTYRQQIDTGRKCRHPGRL